MAFVMQGLWGVAVSELGEFNVLEVYCFRAFGMLFLGGRFLQNFRAKVSGVEASSEALNLNPEPEAFQ